MASGRPRRAPYPTMTDLVAVVQREVDRLFSFIGPCMHAHHLLAADIVDYSSAACVTVQAPFITFSL